jgi:hypothetical protein
MNTRTWIAAAFGLLGLGAIALAQPVVAPQVQVINPGDLFQDVVNGSPQAQSYYATASQITAQSGYYKSAPLTGFTFTFANNQTNAAFRPAGTLAAGYIVAAPNPSDGARECIFTTAAITGTYWAANTGQSINNALSNTTIAANTGACYLYSASNATWDRD